MAISVSIKDKVGQLVEGILLQEKMELFGFNIFYQKNNLVIRVLADYFQGGITLSDCARVNKKIGDALEKENVFLGKSYIVEVDSPGATRLLKEEKDFRRIEGKNISVWLKNNQEDKSYFEGILKKIDKEKITISTVKGDREIYFSNIKSAKEKL